MDVGTRKAQDARVCARGNGKPRALQPAGLSLVVHMDPESKPCGARKQECCVATFPRIRLELISPNDNGRQPRHAICRPSAILRHRGDHIAQRGAIVLTPCSCLVFHCEVQDGIAQLMDGSKIACARHFFHGIKRWISLHLQQKRIRQAATSSVMAVGIQVCLLHSTRWQHERHSSSESLLAFACRACKPYWPSCGQR